MTLTSIKPSALLVDFDGVIRHWPVTDHAIEESHGLPSGAIRGAAFERQLLDAVLTGRISDTLWRETVVESLARSYPDAAVSAAVRLWSEPLGMIDQRVIALLSSLREFTSLVLVTNATSRLEDDLETLGLASMFDVVVNSSRIGIAKPERAIFAHALSAAGASPAASLFVDDTPDNVAAATEMGIRSLHYQGYESLLQFLRINGLAENAV